MLIVNCQKIRKTKLGKLQLFRCFSDTVKGRHGLRDELAEIGHFIDREDVSKTRENMKMKRKEKKKISVVKKISSVYGKKFLSMKCLIFEISNL